MGRKRTGGGAHGRGVPFRSPGLVAAITAEYADSRSDKQRREIDKIIMFKPCSLSFG